MAQPRLSQREVFSRLAASGGMCGPKRHRTSNLQRSLSLQEQNQRVTQIQGASRGHGAEVMR
ncbi:hypothetical protein VC83_03339 [Pseudogymnoascus destructans]|uniref:Uncharacterized protein n=1 Tax=Pseudogymnoascus destructans TaxID=655981 RepID=A0A177AHK8_9PEZI|nr:uncharacterized protein VC83_03339 [Pseudogymnoascus destructans]OAF60723.1 hypothetical protein VC83_03339 [Pseudogymnoascus destructans]